MTIIQEWENLLVDTSIAENHNLICGDPRTLKVDEVESIIVSGLLIRAISILDYALELFIDNNNISISHKNPKLFHRLEALKDANLLVDHADIEIWRKRRNDVGHRINEKYKWSELKQCLTSIFRELNSLNILNDYPQLKAEKVVQRVTPSEGSVKIEQAVTVTISDSQKIYSQFGWRIKV